VVLVTQQASNNGLYAELTRDEAALARAGIRAVHVIGDAVAPRIISEAVFDGHRLAREIDQPDPDRPVPYLRETPDLRATPGEPGEALPDLRAAQDAISG
jgi:dimethylamine/trimethylamine dehydrogenase